VLSNIFSIGVVRRDDGSETGKGTNVRSLNPDGLIANVVGFWNG
jgi:hypothetical protein